MKHRVVTLKCTDVSEVRTVSIRAIVLMMEAVNTSETSVHDNMTAWLYIPEDSFYLVLFS
jgi:hypothetical protein